MDRFTRVIGEMMGVVPTAREEHEFWKWWHYCTGGCGHRYQKAHLDRNGRCADCRGEG